MRLLFLLLSSLLVVSGSDVVELNKNSFDGFIGQDLTLVEFFAPWCGHCKQLAPEYEIAATELKALGVPLATVDATVEAELAGRFSVSGYPTLKVFRNGKPSDYNGPRKAAGIVSYMKKQIGPAAKPVTTQKELEALIASDPDTKYAVVGFFTSTSSQLHSSFAILSNRLRDEFVFGKVMTNDALNAAYGVQDEAIIAFLNGEKTVYTGNSQTKNVEEFIRQNSVPLVGELTENNHELFTKRGLPVAKYYVKLDRAKNSKQNTYYLNRIKKIAQEFQGKITMVVADKVTHKDAAANVGFDASVDQGFVIEKDGKIYQYDGLEGKTLDVAAITNFIKEYLADKIKPWIRSERIPKNNDGPVKVVVGQTFDEIVNDEDTDVLIEFYAPWCGHCKQLEPIYKQLGEKFTGNEDVAIAKIDATANDFDRTRFAVSGYPTMFLVPAKKNATPIKYEGGRDLEDMFQFVKKNAKNKSVRNHGKKKKGGKKKKQEESDEE